MTDTNNAEQTARAGALVMLDHWIKTFNSVDPDALTALYAPDATLLGTTSSKHYVGRAEIRSYFRGRSDVEMKSMELQVLSGGEVLISGLYDFLRPRDTHAICTPSRFSLLLGQQDGHWYVLHQHSSAAPLAPSD